MVSGAIKAKGRVRTSRLDQRSRALLRNVTLQVVERTNTPQISLPTMTRVLLFAGVLLLSAFSLQAFSSKAELQYSIVLNEVGCREV